MQACEFMVFVWQEKKPEHLSITIAFPTKELHLFITIGFPICADALCEQWTISLSSSFCTNGPWILFLILSYYSFFFSRFFPLHVSIFCSPQHTSILKPSLWKCKRVSTVIPPQNITQKLDHQIWQTFPYRAWSYHGANVLLTKFGNKFPFS